MKPIKITESNRDAITKVIKDTEGKATARTITAEDVFSWVVEVERHLARFSTKIDMVGTVINVDDNAQHFPSSYRYTPESTHFTAMRKRDGWVLTGVTRARCMSRNTRVFISLTEATKANMAAKLSEL